jgi:DNA-binding LacI/PurR family transcriptional regulator
MHDVAAVAGVSHQTVSRVLNEYEGIRPATRERVLAAIAELGYRRNLAARTLATGRSHSIGVLSPVLPNFGPSSSLHAVEQAAIEAGFRALVTSTSPEPAHVSEALDYLLGKSVDALVLLAQQNSVLEAVDAIAPDLPAVYLLTGGARAEWSISVDQGAGARLATEHLIGLGHRRIQHVTGDTAFMEAQLRKAAFDEHIASAGLERLPSLEGSWSADSGYEAGRRIDPRTTAVFCGNDQMAIGVLHALSDAGRRVPQDVSVVGFDDLPEGKHSLPPLTTVHQDFRGVGKIAVEVLLARLNNEHRGHTAPLAPWLVERASTAPPPAGT